MLLPTGPGTPRVEPYCPAPFEKNKKNRQTGLPRRWASVAEWDLPRKARFSCLTAAARHDRLKRGTSVIARSRTRVNRAARVRLAALLTNRVNGARDADAGAAKTVATNHRVTAITVKNGLWEMSLGVVACHDVSLRLFAGRCGSWRAVAG
jgi:hypothetical protein